MEYRERRGPSSPINVGDVYDVQIEDVGREGDGIARVEGFVVFVPNTKKGDNVKVRISKVSRRVGFGEVVSE
ncbi:MAG: TRAM domain-containing protein [Methanophagales archaeon]|nr:TRAM domain-containing protein [Methanophagales archaeon]RLG35887.1 MAG: deoxyribonuclease [Methanosarcinales archaeon]MCW3138867.1 TRAM domain-containing protein [Methanophagales archaeon]MCW3139344.1 TRAM domain-containing protein [Methanophagales archaeon]MCW7069108.1 TRAM domain-containing protein [Methanophagales archaeon]